MLIFLIIFLLCIHNICISFDYERETHAKRKIIKSFQISENEKYISFILEGTWTDNLGLYGTYKCNASSYKRIEKVILDGICEGVNQHNEKYWYKINRNSSTMDAGVGKQTYLEGTGRYKVLKGISCNYGVRYLDNINYVKTKCVINENIKGLLEK